MYFCYIYFLIISPWIMESSSTEQTCIPFTQGCFVPSLVEIGLLGLEKRIFLILSMYVCYIIIFFPWKRAWPFIWINLNPLYPRMLCTKFGWNWPRWAKNKEHTHLHVTKGPMGHIVHQRNISSPQASFHKAIPKQTGWFKVAIISMWKRLWSFIWKTWIF